MPFPTNFKPMLAATVTRLEDLPNHRWVVSPKIDGIRAMVCDGVVYSRSLKPIPNKFVQYMFGHRHYNGFDGELVVGSVTAPNVMQETTSGVMSVGGEPDVKFHLFDDWSRTCVYSDWLDRISRLDADQRVVIVPQATMATAAIPLFEDRQLNLGYEGIMLRREVSRYKHGRSTLNEGHLLKLKRFSDNEARVVGFQELMANENEATKDNLGHTKRSTAQAGKRGKGVLGALQVQGIGAKFKGALFNVGGGFTDAQRAELWARRMSLVGKVITYKHFDYGTVDAPRFPTFKAFRDERDL